MKLLSIHESTGHFRGLSGEFAPIDLLKKEDLLRLANLTLGEDEVDFDAFDEKLLKNQAHQVIYKSVYLKLAGLRSRRKEFLDESARLFLEEYEKYRDAA